MLYHTPKPPTTQDLVYLQSLVVDTVNGKVYNKAGKELGYTNPKNNRVSIKVPKGRQYRRYHIVWWKFHGEWPEQELDHRNRIRYDDRIDNLRLADREMQMFNANPGRCREQCAYDPDEIVLEQLVNSIGKELKL